MFKGFSEYQPTKTQTFWSCVFCIVATLVLGFTWGGWTTSGGAEEMAGEAAEQARVELGAALCVEKFTRSADAAERLDTLKGASPYSRSGLVEDEGWATLLGRDEPDSAVADACAERIADLDSVPAPSASTQAAAGDQDGDASTVQ